MQLYSDLFNLILANNQAEFGLGLLELEDEVQYLAPTLHQRRDNKYI
jgi:hypothetical protein